MLEVLANTEGGLNASQIARLSSRGTRTGQAPVLARLVEHGLLATDLTPTGPLYRFNRDHLLARALLEAVDARASLLGRLRTGLTNLSPEPVHSSVYGSFARRDGDASSDIDVLLVVSDDLDIHGDVWTEQVSVLADEVLAWTGNRLEPLTFTTSRLIEICSAGERIVDEWLCDAIDLTGTPLRSLPGMSERSAAIDDR